MTDDQEPGRSPDEISNAPVSESGETRSLSPEELRRTRQEDGSDEAPRVETPTWLESTFEVLEVIGEGGMGVVYSARNLALGRVVALKVLRSLRNSRDVDRFLLEARSLARIEHHNVVTVYHVGRRGDACFLEMQHIDGESLDRRLTRGPLSPEEAARIVEQVAHALDHAHARGLIHRDIKPSNILLTSDGVVKVVDFGLALPLEVDVNLTQEGHIVGTPTYMAPEQWRGREFDARTDLYLLGVTFFELLIGKPPFEGTLAELMQCHLELPPVPPAEIDPSIPKELSRIVEKLLEKAPEKRYQRAADLITDLRLFEQGAPPTLTTSSPPLGEAHAGPADPFASTRKLGWRGTALVAVIVAAVVLLLGGTGFWRRAELLTEDLRLVSTGGGSGPEAGEVSVVMIDSTSKDELAPDRPLSRAEHHAELLLALADLGALAVGVDLLFIESISPQEDGQLASATQLASRTVHAVNVSEGEARRGGSELERIQPTWTLAPPREIAERLRVASRVDLPVPSIAEASAQIGHVALLTDADGVIRSLPIALDVGGRVLPSLSLAAVLRAWDVSPAEVRWTSDGLSIPFADGSERFVPLGPAGTLRLNPRWKDCGIQEISLAEILAVAPDEEVARAIRNRIVFVGSRLDGDYDVGALAGQPVVPLVLAHALAADSIRRGEFVRTSSGLLAAICVILLALLGGALARLPGLWAMLALLGSACVVWGFAFFEASGATRTLVPLVPFTVALLGSGLCVVLVRAIGEDRERRRLAGLLSRYLSPGVTRRVLFGSTPPRIGGKRRELTLLAVKVHDLARVSERLEPEEIDDLLRRFFERATDVVFRHEGTLDDFSGDGLRAFFGDPEPQEDHAVRAVRCAIELRKACAEAIAEWRSLGRPPLGLGIGVHTGYVTVGNIGSSRRMEYTALGRNVEIAEELARRARGQVLVSDRTHALTLREISYAAAPESAGEPPRADERIDPGKPWNAIAPLESRDAT